MGARNARDHSYIEFGLRIKFNIGSKGSQLTPPSRILLIDYIAEENGTSLSEPVEGNVPPIFKIH